MCESNVYMVSDNGEEKLFMESVDRIVPEEDGIYLQNIFAETKKVKARIKEMELVQHRIVLEKQAD